MAAFISEKLTQARMYLIIMELDRIFVRTNLRNWPKNLQRTRTKLLSAVQGVTLMGISIVSLRNEDFLMFCLCLTTGCHLGLTEKLQNSRSRRLFATSSWGNAVMAFSPSSQCYICGCEWYKLYSGVLHPGRSKATRWRNCGPPISGLAIAQFLQYVKTHATTNVCLHVSTYCYETQHNQKLYTSSDQV